MGSNQRINVLYNAKKIIKLKSKKKLRNIQSIITAAQKRDSEGESESKLRNIQSIITAAQTRDSEGESESKFSFFPPKEAEKEPETQLGSLCVTMGMVALQPALKEELVEQNVIEPNVIEPNGKRINMF